MSETMQAGMMLANSILQYKDRKRQQELDAKAEERADARFQMEKETYQRQKELDQLEANRKKAQQLWVKGRVQLEGGDTAAAGQTLQQMNGLMANGFDAFQVHNMDDYTQEEKDDFFARNPDLSALRDKGIIIDGYDTVQDRRTRMGFDSMSQAYDETAKMLAPKNYMASYAKQAASADQINDAAQVTPVIDEQTGEVKYFMDRATLGEHGNVRKDRIELTPEEANKRDSAMPTIVSNMMKAFQTKEQKSALESESTIAGIQEKKAQTVNIKATTAKTMASLAQAEQPYSPDRQTLNQASNMLHQYATDINPTDTEASASFEQSLAPYMKDALIANKGDTANVVQTAMKVREQQIRQKQYEDEMRQRSTEAAAEQSRTEEKARGAVNRTNTMASLSSARTAKQQRADNAAIAAGKIVKATGEEAKPSKDWGTRADGSSKGTGYFGVLKHAGGTVSSELSIGVEMDGKETEIPLLVPGLTYDEISSLLKGDDPTEAIVDKAITHARKRISEGKSPFATAKDKPVALPKRTKKKKSQ